MNTNKIKAVALLILLSLVWGASFLLIKKGLLVYSAGQVGALRIIFAGLTLLPVLVWKWKSVAANKPWDIVLYGVFEIGIPPFLFAYAETVLSSSTTGILNSLTPLFTLLAGVMLFRLKTNARSITGVFVGLIGALVLTLFRDGLNFDPGNFGGDSAWYAMLVIIAGILYGVAGNLLKERLNSVDDVVLIALMFTSMSIPAGIYLLTTDIFSIPVNNSETLMSLASIFFLSLVNSALAIYLFSKLTKLSDALFASFVTYIIPFVAILLGALDGEELNSLHFTGLGIIFLGIYIANRDSFRPRRRNRAGKDDDEAGY